MTQPNEVPRVVIPLKLKYRCLKTRGTHKSTGNSFIRKGKGISIPTTGRQRQMVLVLDGKTGRRKWMERKDD